MSEPILSARDMLGRSDNQSHRYNLLSALLGPNDDVVPLDNGGNFSLIRTTRYHQLLETLKEAQQLKMEMEQKCHSLSITNVQINKEHTLLLQKMQQFKHNQQQLSKMVDRLLLQLKNSKATITNLQGQLRTQALKSVQTAELQLVSLPSRPSTTCCGVQTAFTTSQEELPEIIAAQIEAKKDASMEEQLYAMIHSRTQQFEEEFKTRIKQLEQCQLQLDTWEQEKEAYRVENQRLKTLAEARNLQDQQLRIWQDSVNHLVQGLQTSIRHNSQPGNEQESRAMEVEAIERGREAQLRLRLKEVDQMMAVEEVAEEEGPVVALVRLSQKVKSMVRGLLLEADSPT